MIFAVFGAQTIGGRDYQQDEWRARSLGGKDVTTEAGRGDGITLKDGCLAVMADGAGGHLGGEVASRIVADTLTESFFASPPDDPHQAFIDALGQISHRLASEKAREASLNEMASTVVAGHFDARTKVLNTLSVGDSSILRLRNDELHILNGEHNYGIDLDEQAFASGEASAWDSAVLNPSRVAISSALTGNSHMVHQIHTTDLQPDDIVIFASDGLLGPLTHEHVRRFMLAAKKDGGLGTLVPRLIDAVDQLGARMHGNAHDNATIVAVHVIGESRNTRPGRKSEQSVTRPLGRKKTKRKSSDEEAPTSALQGEAGPSGAEDAQIAEAEAEVPEQEQSAPQSTQRQRPAGHPPKTGSTDRQPPDFEPDQEAEDEKSSLKSLIRNITGWGRSDR